MPEIMNTDPLVCSVVSDTHAQLWCLTYDLQKKNQDVKDLMDTKDKVEKGKWKDSMGEF